MGQRLIVCTREIRGNGIEISNTIAAQNEIPFAEYLYID